MQLRFHQIRTIDGINEARQRGVKRLCIQGNTGVGKTITFLTLARQEVERGGRVAVYTDRKVVRSQISDVFNDNELYHGVRAAGTQPILTANVQVSSIMTERSRSLGENAFWQLHDATLVIVDEAHRNKAKVATTILDQHYQKGAFITGWTATPVGLKGLYDEIITMTTLAEMREHGWLVWCDVYAPEEVDMSGIKMVAGEFHQGQMRGRVKQTIVVGNVIEHWERLNQDHRPTVLFAPGVPESRWLVEQLAWHGVSAAHMDAKTRDPERQRIFEAWRNGDIEIVSNFGILREGFDFQACSHAILVQPTNRVSTYLQMVGRILRAAEGKDRAVLQDHTGAYWRHGDPNEDREWTLDDTDQSIARERKKRQKAEREDDGPSLCPECGAVRYLIPGFYGRCPHCGYEGTRLKRMVRQTDGKLVKVKPRDRRRTETDDLLKTWRSCIYIAARSNMTAGQAVGMCNRKTGKWVRQSISPWPVPKPKDKDWFRPASEVWPDAT